jgi:osmoprotectant transport system substrate-binding protein
MRLMKPGFAALVGVVALTAAACGGGNPTSPNTGGKAPAGTIVVGSANFPESALIAEIYAEALQSKGVKVSTKLNIGSREAYIPGLKDGSIDLIPEYSGVLLQYFDKSATQTTSSAVYAALKKAVPPPLTVLKQSSAQDKDAVVVTAATAKKYHLKSIADLKPVAKQMTFGGPPEFQTRPDGIPGLKKNYGVVFGSYKVLDTGGPVTVSGLKNGQVQAADLFTTDPSIPENNFVVLADPKSNFAAQNVLPLINKTKLTPTVTKTLNAISAKLTTSTLSGLLKKVYAKQNPTTVAKAWLTSKGLM